MRPMGVAAGAAALGVSGVLAVLGCTVGFDVVRADLEATVDRAGVEVVEVVGFSPERLTVRGFEQRSALTARATVVAASADGERPAIDWRRAPPRAELRLTLGGQRRPTVYADAVELDLPAAAGLRHHTHCGRLDVVGLSGPIDLRTTTCRVNIDGDGPLDAVLSEGDLTARLRAAARIESEVGDVHLTLVGGAVAPVSATVAHGDLTVELPPGEGFDLFISVDGTIVWALPEPPPPGVEASPPVDDAADAGAGSAQRVDLRFVEWSINGGGPRLTLDVEDGRLTLTPSR